jgi:hypothetical protein
VVSELLVVQMFKKMAHGVNDIKKLAFLFDVNIKEIKLFESK